MKVDLERAPGRAAITPNDAEAGQEGLQPDAAVWAGRSAPPSVLERPEWTGIEVEHGYRLTVRLIDGAIVHIRPQGHASLSAVRRAVAMTTDIVRDQIEEGRPHVLLSDYSELEGATFEARRFYVDSLKDRPGLVGMVFCGGSPLIRTAIRLGQRLHLAKVNVAVVGELDEAIAVARGMLGIPPVRRQEGTDGWTEGGVPNAEGARPEWQLALDGFSLTWELIDGRILHGAPSGYLGIDHVEPIRKLTEQVVGYVRGTGRRPSIIVNLAGLAGTTLSGRRLFVREFRQWLSSDPFERFAFYGGNALLRGALAVWAPFLPEGVAMARDLERALAVVRDDHTRRRPRRRSIGPWARRAATVRQSEVDDLLRFLSNIAWEADGMVERDPDLPADHPMAPVFDAVTLIKADVDQLLRDRRVAEAALRQSEERYRNILANIVEGYYEIDTEGRLTFCNDAMARMLGLGPGELAGRRGRDLVAPALREQVLADLRRVVESGEPAVALDWRLLRRDGSEAPVEVSVSLMRRSDGTAAGFRGIIRDVSERVQVEHEREELESRLRHAQRMEAIGTLAGGIAHNFNNLLMGIQGNVSLLESEIDPLHPHQARLLTVEELVRGGAKLTAQLLGYARAGRYEIQTFDLNPLVRQTVETFGLARKEVRVHQAISAGQLPVRADRGQIEQVLLNLFVNAADAMPGGGDLYVSTELSYQGAPDDRSYRQQPAIYARIEVRDTGTGMDGDTIRRIFDPFFTTKGMSGGSGLGLTSSYGTVKAHGGYIEVSSELGVGSTFTICLPLTDSQAEAPIEQREEPVAGQGKVLVVDDDEAVLEACGAILELLDYTTIRVSSGRQALEVYRERGDEIDLVVLDMILPDISGGEVYDGLRAIDPRVRVLLSSGYSIDGEAQRILGRGCDDFIQKPFTIEQLSRKVAGLLARR